MARTPYLVLRGSTYAFRVRVPPHLVGLVGREQLWRSLRTGQVAEARRRSLHLLSLTDALWSALHPNMTPVKAKALVDQWLTAKLESDADIRDLPRRPSHNRAMFRRTPPWRPDKLVKTLSETEFERTVLQRVGDPTALPPAHVVERKISPQDIARRALSKLTKDAEQRRRLDDDVVARPLLLAWLEEQGLAPDETAPGFRAGVRFMLKLLSDLQQATAVRDAGHWYRWGGPDPAARFYPGAEAPSPTDPGYSPQGPATGPIPAPQPFGASTAPWPQPAPIAPQPAPPAAQQGPRERFKDAAEEALREIARTETQSNMREDEYTKAVELFMAWLEADPYLDEITTRVAGAYKVDLTYYPKNANKRAAYRNLSVKARIAKAKREHEHELLDAGTVNSNYLTPLRRIFDWLNQAGRGPSANPFVAIRATRARGPTRRASGGTSPMRRPPPCWRSRSSPAPRVTARSPCTGLGPAGYRTGAFGCR